MNREMLTDVSRLVVDALLEHGVDERDLVMVLRNCCTNIVDTMHVRMTIDDRYLMMLRDIIWFNLERREGEDSLVSWGSGFPKTMTFADVEDVISTEDVEPLREELRSLRVVLDNPDVFACNLVGDDKLFVPNARVIFVDKRRKPSLPKQRPDTKHTLTCFVRDELSTLAIDRIKMFGLIDELIEACDQALKRDVGIHVDWLTGGDDDGERTSGEADG